MAPDAQELRLLSLEGDYLHAVLPLRPSDEYMDQQTENHRLLEQGKLVRLTEPLVFNRGL